jgi:hypothetical protein
MTSHWSSKKLNCEVTLNRSTSLPSFLSTSLFKYAVIFLGDWIRKLATHRNRIVTIFIFHISCQFLFFLVLRIRSNPISFCLIYSWIWIFILLGDWCEMRWEISVFKRDREMWDLRLEQQLKLVAILPVNLLLFTLIIFKSYDGKY